MSRPPVYSGFQVTFDAADPDRLARFWALALRYEIEPPPEGFGSWPEALKAWGVPEERWGSASAIVDPEGAGPRVFFQRVPEGKSAKNRVHLDVRSARGQELSPEAAEQARLAHVDLLQGAGAEVVEHREEMGGAFVVMRDIEGNEFCVS